MISSEVIRKVRQIQIRTSRRVHDVFAGAYHSVFKGRGMEFREVREYCPGDDIRAIDWNVTARMNHPFVKQFTEERELTILLLADVSASNRFGSGAQLKRDLVAEMSAVLAFAAIQNNDRVGLLLFSDRVERYIPPKKGVTHVLRVIREALDHRPQGRGTRLSPALEFLNHVATRQAIVFLISDFIAPPEEYDRALAVTARRHDLISVVIGDRREQAWPKAGLVWWEDAETGRRRLVDTSSDAVRRAFAARQADRRAARLRRFGQLRVDAIPVNTGEPYERALRRFFEVRERRRSF